MELAYCTIPYNHQISMLVRGFAQPSFAYFAEMGCGKSKVVVDEIYNLHAQGKINCAIILAPNEVHAGWAEEFAKHGFPGWKIVVQVYRSRLGKRQEEATREGIKSGKLFVFLMNIEAVASGYAKEYLQRILLARRNTYFAIDESQTIKSMSAVRTKRVIKLGELARYRRILTGTEISEGLHEFYSQFRFLDRRILGHTTFTSFRGMYCVMGGFENRQIVRYQNEELLAARIAPYCFQIRKKDCLDLPEQVYVRHKIAMTPEQRELYMRLIDEILVELDDGRLVDVSLAITRLLRLQQVTCGHLECITIPSHRAPFVAGLVEGLAGKALVFTRFQKDVELCLEALGELGVGFTGEVSPEARRAILEGWRTGKAKALVMTAATGGVGLTLNEANTTIFYSNGFSSAQRLQAEARNHRIGQGEKVTYHDIVVPRSIDERILRTLQSKKDMGDAFRSLIDIRAMLLAPLDEAA